MDLHTELILEEYRAQRPVFEKMQVEVERVLKDALKRSGLVVTAVTSRIKTEDSLTGKLAFEAGKTSAEAWKNSSQATVSCCGMGQKRGHVALTRPHHWLLPIAFG